MFTALLACLFVVMVTADRFACPDGCTDDATSQATSQHAASSCAFCHGWNQAPAVMASRPATRPIAKPRLVFISPTEPALFIVERPPKAT